MDTKFFKKLGLDNATKEIISDYSNYFLGRVSEQHKNIYKVLTDAGELLAKVSGKYSYLASTKSEYPVVGDWVLLDSNRSDKGDIIIHYLLPRRTKLQRKEPGTKEQIQVLVANIDYVFICMSLNNDFNLRRLERYLTVAWDSGAMPIIVLTKKDLCSNVEEKIAEVKNIASNIDIITTSNNDSETINALKKYISIGKSVVFVGSSGVGKSTLINLIAGHDLIKTKEIRKDDRGRHTTTNRQLLILPMGGIVIDTPGLREIQIETGDIGRSFEDIKALIQNCKFKNCTHQNEPGCAIRKAIEKGIIDSKRYNNYLKLSKEINYESLNSKEIENEKIKNMFGSKTNYKKMINEVKKKNKRY